jgi:hypothetical protein
VIAEGLTVRDNEATGPASAPKNGGGLAAVDADVQIASSSFESNEAAEGGGLSILRGALVLDTSVVTTNTSTVRGGAVFSRASTLSLTDVVLADSAATTAGGALFAEGCETTLQSVTVEGNRAESGGGIMIEGGAFVAEGLTVRDNEASTHLWAPVNGGGLAAVDADVQIANSSFESNGAVNGGGLWILGGALVLDSSVITANTLAVVGMHVFGGGVYAEDAAVTLRASTLSANDGDMGSAAMITRGTLAASEMQVVDNVGNDGGAFIVESLVGSLVDSEISGNTCCDHYTGPAGLDVRMSTLDLSGTIIHDNVGNTGGLMVTAPATLTGGEVSSNFGSSDAGGVLVYPGNGATDTVTITAMSIVGNTVGDVSAAYANGLSVQGAETVLDDVVLRDNAGGLSLAGGLSVLSGGSITLNGCTVEGNDGDAGGGAYVEWGGGSTLSSHETWWGDNTPNDVWAAKQTYLYDGIVSFDCDGDGCW